MHARRRAQKRALRRTGPAAVGTAAMSAARARAARVGAPAPAPTAVTGDIEFRD